MNSLKEEFYKLQEENIIVGTEDDNSPICLYNVLDGTISTDFFNKYIELYYKAHGIKAEKLCAFPRIEYQRVFMQLLYWVEPSKRNLWKGDGKWIIDLHYTFGKAENRAEKLKLFESDMILLMLRELRSMATKDAVIRNYLNDLHDNKRISENRREKICRLQQSKRLQRILNALNKNCQYTDIECLIKMENELYRQVHLNNFGYN